MISYLEYKLLKEADTPSPPAPASPTAASQPPARPETSPPPGFSGGPPMPDMGGSGPGSFDMSGMGGSPSPSAANLKPSGLKSSNVWDVLEKIVEE